MAHMTDTNFQVGSLRRGLSHWITDAKSAFEKRGIYNRTLNELESLTTRELDDLGLASADLHRIARETAYGF